MLKRFSRNTLLSLAIAFCLATTAAADEVAVNGGFETGDFTGWQQFPSGTQEVGGFDPTEGAFAARLFNDNPASASLIKNANVGIGIVNPGDLVRISFDARGAFNAGGVAFAEFFSELDGGGTSSSEILGGGPLALSADPAEWTSFSFDVFAGPDVSGGITLQLTATTGGDPSSLADVFYDNVSINVNPTVVPEPSACLLLSLGGLAVLRRRRR